MIQAISRFVLVTGGLLGGYAVTRFVDWQNELGLPQYYVIFLLIILGGAIGYVLGGIVGRELTRVWAQAEQRIRETAPADILAPMSASPFQPYHSAKRILAPGGRYTWGKPSLAFRTAPSDMQYHPIEKGLAVPQSIAMKWVQWRGGVKPRTRCLPRSSMDRAAPETTSQSPSRSALARSGDRAVKDPS